MPVGEALVGHVVDSPGLQRVGDVEHDAVARTGARGDTLGRKDGDVVALVGDPSVLSAFAMVATAPEAGDLALRGEHPWPVDDPRCSGIGDGDFDHIDAEERRAVIALDIEATGQFLVLPDEGRARTVDDDPAIARIDHRMRVASAAGLHLADLAWQRKVGNVEDPDTAEAFVADSLGYALQAAVATPARLFHAHDKELADDRDVALPAGADGRADQLRHPVGAEPVGIEAVVAPSDHDAVGKSHVGVGEVEQRAALGEGGLRAALRPS